MTLALPIIFLLLLSLLALGYWISSLLLYSRRQPVTCTPGDYGLAYEDITFSSADGLSLKGWWIPADSASNMDEQAPAIILLHPIFGNRHGYQSQSQAWSYLLRTEVDLLKAARSFHTAGYAVLLFDFRGHGESQGGLCGGGMTEDQDVVGAIEYIINRMTAAMPAESPQVGLVGFGTGASAAIAAIGREKGGAETIRIFSGDSEGGSGWTEIQPANVKKLRFLVAVEPVSLGVLLRGYLRQLFTPLGLMLVPVVKRMCQWRGGYPLKGELLLKYARGVNIPALYVQVSPDMRSGWASESDSGEVQRLFDATPGSKQLWSIDKPLERPGVYRYVIENLDPVLAFVMQHINPQRTNH